jgi:hypothetical protein
MNERWLRKSSRVIGALSLDCAMVHAHASPALAYMKFGAEVRGENVTLKWTTIPVRYFVTNSDAAGVSAGEFQRAVADAFSTWEAVPTSAIAYEFGGFTRNLPGEDDGRSTLGFLDEPDLDRVLASTSYLVDAVSGELIEADIFFNSAFAWSVDPAGDPDRWDLESIALHEIGHLSGLGHSALGETELLPGGGRRVVSAGAVMFQIALGTGDISGRTLQPDDFEGISDLYPADDFNKRTGSLSGRVTKQGGGVFGAHVVAFNIRTGEMVGNFTLRTDGQFSIAGLTPGPHVVRIEPLDDADIESFFDPAEPTDIDFGARYYDRLVIVPRGGDSGTVTIAVAAK